MNFSDLPLDLSERIQFTLRRLYDSHGYRRYRMNKFEEYDLYARNKDFLISDHVLTFTDSDGKLMALKPDVTLSIVKNSPDEPGVRKLYYNENVYRVSKGTHTFKEIMQTGLECIGDIGLLEVCEVMLLAVRSLESISDNYIFELSHEGIVESVFNSCNIKQNLRGKILSAVSRKSRHTIFNFAFRIY